MQIAAGPNTTPSSRNNELMNVMVESLRKNVTFAVNYKLSMVEQFCVLPNKRRRKKSDVESLGSSTVVNPDTSAVNRENSAPNVQEQKKVEWSIEKHVSINDEDTGDKRRSGRDRKKRDVPLERSRVRYDMGLVPECLRDKSYLTSFPRWWMNGRIISEEIERRRSSRLNRDAFCLTCSICHQIDQTGPRPEPFADGNSVVWIPKKRSEWEDCAAEMTAVCTSAAFKKRVASMSVSKLSQPWNGPLSREYISDRLDIDDPLHGFQIRHKEGGWLQGFILWTNFTTWTNYFKWDSLHPRSGMPLNPQPSAKLDLDGSLADELERLPRSGNPLENGVVCHSVAEISLLGGLGCGEYLLRMALDDIRSKSLYKFVVLQATDSSKGFYEKFGFVRVGAVCRYDNRQVGCGVEPGRTMGYRHWTNPNESERSLEMHGGPSYMMCLKLPADDHCEACGRTWSTEQGDCVSFLDDMMMKIACEDKPVIKQLGSPATPFPKKLDKQNSLAQPITSPTPSRKIAVSTRQRTDQVLKVRDGSSVVQSFQTSCALPFPQTNVQVNTVVGTQKSSLLGSEPCKSKNINQISNLGSKSVADTLNICIQGEKVNGAQSGEKSESQPCGVEMHLTKTRKRKLSSDLSESEKRELGESMQTSKKHRLAETAKTVGQKALPQTLDPERPLPSNPSVIPPKKRGRGRPRKHFNVESSTPTVSNFTKENPSKNNVVASESSIKKDVNPSTSSCDAADGSSPTESDVCSGEQSETKEDKKTEVEPKRKRGRPRIHPIVESSASKSQKVASTKVNVHKVESNETKSTDSTRALRPQRKSNAAQDIANEKPDDTPDVVIENTRPTTRNSLKSMQIDVEKLSKQKVKSYPRDRVHYYNKVVRPKNGKKSDYYFVLNYDEASGMIRIAPMAPRGKLSGKRKGRPRYQVKLEKNGYNIKNEKVTDFDIIPAFMVMKTPLVALEAWDILQ